MYTIIILAVVFLFLGLYLDEECSGELGIAGLFGGAVLGLLVAVFWIPCEEIWNEKFSGNIYSLEPSIEQNNIVIGKGSVDGTQSYIFYYKSDSAISQNMTYIPINETKIIESDVYKLKTFEKETTKALRNKFSLKMNSLTKYELYIPKNTEFKVFDIVIPK